MKTLAAACLFFLLCFLCPGEAPAAEGNHVFLWSVKGAHGTVYLLGSTRVLKSGDYPLDARISAAYAGSRRVMFEADMREMGSREVQKALLAQGTFNDKALLKDHVSAKTYGLLTRRLAASGLPGSPFDKYKPWLCAVSLSGVELNRLGFDPKYGVDAHFFSRASGDNKEMLFLETAASQITLLSKTLADRQEDLLRQSIRELEVIGARYLEIRKAWKTGDEAKMEAITTVSLKEYPRVKDALFTDRNIRWAPKIEALMDREGDSLVIVGAGHLVGEDGLLSLLRKKGHALTQF